MFLLDDLLISNIHIFIFKQLILLKTCYFNLLYDTSVSFILKIKQTGKKLFFINTKPDSTGLLILIIIILK